MYELLDFKKISDDRGNLVVLENSKQIPFDIKRVYYIWGTAKGVERGFHAHRKLRQVAICLAGNCDILFDDGVKKEVITLDKPFQGVTIEPMVWHEMRKFSEGCVFLVLASEKYDESDYIRNYDEFLDFCRREMC